MQIKIFINEILWKTVTVEGTKYQPNQFNAQIQAEKDAGLLSSYNVQEKMAIRYEVFYVNISPILHHRFNSHVVLFFCILITL